MHPLPGQPLPQGWVYIEHPDVGRSDNPVQRSSLGAWSRSGWTECDGPDAVPDAPIESEQAGPLATQSTHTAATTAVPNAEQASLQNVKE